jgi:LPS sulfotransferase NodH
MSRERLLVLCATQRTGSSMMLDDLFNVAGRWGADGEILRNALLTTNPEKAYPVPDWNAAWQLARDKNRVQNVIVTKVMFHYTCYLSAAINGTPPARCPPVVTFQPERFDAFHDFFRNATWVWITRRDIYEQAVSMYVAESLKLWEARASTPDSVRMQERPPYDRARLLVYLEQFAAERAQWPRFFQHYQISPIRLTYEDAAANYPGYLDEVFAAAGLARAAELEERRMLKVGNATNAEYAQLLRKDTPPELYARLESTG